jgi:hypothetical protein
MAPVTRSLSLSVFALLALSSPSIASASPSSSSDLVLDSQLSNEGLFDQYSVDYDEDLLPSPEPADYSDDLFERTILSPSPEFWHDHSKRALSKAWSGKSKFTRGGYTGVGAMQAAVISVRPQLSSFSFSRNKALTFLWLAGPPNHHLRQGGEQRTQGQERRVRLGSNLGLAHVESSRPQLANQLILCRRRMDLERDDGQPRWEPPTDLVRLSLSSSSPHRADFLPFAASITRPTVRCFSFPCRD